MLGVEPSASLLAVTVVLVSGVLLPPPPLGVREEVPVLRRRWRGDPFLRESLQRQFGHFRSVLVLGPACCWWPGRRQSRHRGRPARRWRPGGPAAWQVERVPGSRSGPRCCSGCGRGATGSPLPCPPPTSREEPSRRGPCSGRCPGRCPAPGPEVPDRVPSCEVAGLKGSPS